MAARCERCGQEEYMPFVCRMCNARFCVEHRLPENHACAGLADARARPREPRLYRDPHDEAPRGRPVVRLGPRARLDRFLARWEGRMTPLLLGTMLAVGVAQVLTLLFADADAFRFLFVLDKDFLFRPWTVLTSVFSHGSVGHFFGNALVLFFFGPTLEQLIGGRRFLGLFLATGIVAGLAEVVFFGLIPDVPHGVLGASGAIMGILGTLTVLAPRLTVLVFFVIPAPLWAITAFYALYDVVYLGMAEASPVAHLAHLSGLAIGLLYGKHLRDQGLRVKTERQDSFARYRRYV